MPVEACVNIGSGTEVFPLIAERIGFAEIRHVVEAPPCVVSPDAFRDATV